MSNHYETFTKKEMLETLKTIERLAKVDWERFDAEANMLVGENKYNQMMGGLRYKLKHINYALGVETNA